MLDFGEKGMSEAVLKMVHAGGMCAKGSKLSISPDSSDIFVLSFTKQLPTLVEDVLLKTSSVSLRSPKALLDFLSDASWPQLGQGSL